jgi:two-component system, cell cycle sensor histidine kinase and response regulator CckA
MGTNSQRVERTRGSPARKRILCVDDDPAITRVLTRWLERHGFEAIQTGDPLEALAWVRQAPHAFDAVITDQRMPRLTGLELARAASTTRPELVVFLATALDDRISPDELLDSRVSHLVAKPFDLRALVHSLKEALGISGPTLVAV